MRRSHYIRRNERSETPSNAVWLDTETDQLPAGQDTVGHVLRFGYAAYSRTRGQGRWIKPQWLCFTTRAEFWDWIEGHTAAKKTLYLFCHNTSFDLPVMDIFGELGRRKWKLRTAVIDAPPTILTFSKAGAKIKVLDTLNIWRVPLKMIGEMVGVPKLEMPAPDAPSEAWEAYARRDVEIIMRACMQWWAWLQEEDLGGFAPTLASQAMRTWRHRYMTTPVAVHAQAGVLALERASYHGGRCECFRRGQYGGRFFLCDVNSLYPSVMADGIFPARYLFQHIMHRGWDWRGQAKGRCIIARCTLRTDVPMYPIKHHGKLIFPVGEFDACLCGPELMEADRRGHLVKVHHAAYYTAEPIFRGFVADVYARRVAAQRSGNVTLAHNYKILMNSLYGKFGQRGEVWDAAGNIDDLSARTWTEADATDGTVTRYRQLGGLVQRLGSEIESGESCPAIASYVTSMARMKLWKLIEQAGRANVFYVDTDSLLVNIAGIINLWPEVDAHRLGALKLERRLTWIELRGAKDYTLGATSKTKGVRTKAVWLDRDTVQQERWRGLRGQLADGIIDRPTTGLVTKHLSRNYTKGYTGPDGVVRPLTMPAP